MSLIIDVPEQLSADTQALVSSFAEALAEKLYQADLKYNFQDNWKETDWMNTCREQLREHLEKGDPRDVAIYAAFLWYHGETTKI